MRFSVNFFAAFGLAATIAVASAASANAECKRFGFTVNDYGKDGPTKDAKDLLDKLIATKMTERGVSDFRTGKKSVSCELFLNFIVFDEHTCTAEATVCWGGSKLPGAEQADAEPASDTDQAAAEEKHAQKKATKEAAVHTNPAPAPHKSAAAIPDPKSVLKKKAVEKKEAAATASVETGSLSESTTKHKAHQKAADDSGEVAPVKQNADGYPTPEAPATADGGAQ
ncbi:MAG: hypothetical protein ABW006_00975 [Hyphomicrobium sp.]